MAKQKKRSKRYSTTKSTPPAAAEPRTRRDILRQVRNGGIAAALLGTGGWFAVRDVQATIREHDLTRIGNGVPTIVQIHDPQCSQCVALQKQARVAMKKFAETELQYVVANIRDDEGSRLANAHGVGKTTLLLMDGDGRRREILRGVSSDDYLERAFRQFLSELPSS